MHQNEKPKGYQSENLFRALKSDYLEENKADLATNMSAELLQKKAESLAGNWEVVFRGRFLDPIVN